MLIMPACLSDCPADHCIGWIALCQTQHLLEIEEGFDPDVGQMCRRVNHQDRRRRLFYITTEMFDWSSSYLFHRYTFWVRVAKTLVDHCMFPPTTWWEGDRRREGEDREKRGKQEDRSTQKEMTEKEVSDEDTRGKWWHQRGFSFQMWDFRTLIIPEQAAHSGRIVDLHCTLAMNSRSSRSTLHTGTLTMGRLLLLIWTLWSQPMSVCPCYAMHKINQTTKSFCPTFVKKKRKKEK